MSNVDDTEDTLETVLLRIAALDYANNIQQEELDTLRSTVTRQEQIIADLQVSDNSTNDRVQVVEDELEAMDIAVQGKCLILGLRENYPYLKGRKSSQ